jgi:glycosyltransferase involved in cell wall biosynthesis
VKKTLRVLYIEAGHGLGGSSISLAENLSIISTQGIEPFVLLTKPHAVDTFFAAPYVKVIKTPIKQSALKTFPKSIRFLRELTGRVFPAARKIERLIRTHNIDVVHGNNDVSSNMPGLLAARLARVPYVQHLRTTRTPTRSERMAARFVREFVAVSDWGANHLRRVFPAAGRRMRVIRDTIDVSAALKATPALDETEEALPESSHGVKIGIFSNLVEGKGHDVFLDAAREVISKGIPASFFIFGGKVPGHEAYAKRIERAASTSEFAQHVRFMGFRKNVLRYMAAMDVVVEASSLPEGLQRTLAEALLLERAVIITDTGGGRELAEDGKTALVVKTSSADALAAAVQRLVTNPDERSEIAAQGAEKARRLFNPHTSARLLMELY